MFRNKIYCPPSRIKVKPTELLFLTLTYDLDFHSPASNGRDSYTCKKSVNGQLVKKLEWKQTGGLTDTTDCSTLILLAPSVKRLN